MEVKCFYKFMLIFHYYICKEKFAKNHVCQFIFFRLKIEKKCSKTSDFLSLST